MTPASRSRTSGKIPWFYKVEIPSKYDPALLVTRIEKSGRRTKYPFESEAQAKRETKLLREYLEKAGRPIGRRYLLPKLRGCNPPDAPCGMPICRVCMRQYRRAVVSQTLPHVHRKMDEGYRPFYCTFVYSQRRLRLSGIQTKTLQKFLKLPQNLRQWLTDNGLDDLMVSGSIEFDWSKKDEVWEPHCHLLIMAKSKRQLSRAFGRYFKSQKRDNKTRMAVRQGKRISEVDLPNLPRALAYSVKFSPKLRVPRKRGDVRLRKRPELEDRERYTAIKWLGMLEPEDLIVRRKLHLIGSTGPSPRIIERNH